MQAAHANDQRGRREFSLTSTPAVAHHPTRMHAQNASQLWPPDRTSYEVTRQLQPEGINREPPLLRRFSRSWTQLEGMVFMSSSGRRHTLAHQQGPTTSKARRDHNHGKPHKTHRNCGTRMTRTPPEHRRRLTGGAQRPQEGILRRRPMSKQNASTSNSLPRGLARHASDRN